MSFEFDAQRRSTHNSKFITQNSLVEPLTARELEVLRLLGSGLSNQAIAQQLVVAVGTVKRHIANILSKLQVDSRLAAVARARELGLL
jgi:ATP/maltotriose-dependent transcriptional regulator MalT